MKDDRLAVAEMAARAGGEIAMRYFRKGPLNYKEKERISDVQTIADIESGSEIISIIRKSFHHDNVLSEETGFLDNGGEHTWVIDDLDGTNPFRAGLPNFGVSVGCLYNNEPFLGAISLPFFGEIYSAEKGKGSYLNGTRIFVNDVEDLKKARVCIDYGHFGRRQKDLSKTSYSLIEEALYLDSYGCASESQCFVARGLISAYLHHDAYPWDFCAGTIIIQEAGGKVTDHEGKPLNWSKKDGMFLLASNGLVHDQILKLINK